MNNREKTQIGNQVCGIRVCWVNTLSDNDPSGGKHDMAIQLIWPLINVRPGKLDYYIGLEVASNKKGLDFEDMFRTKQNKAYQALLFGCTLWLRGIRCSLR